MSSSKKVPKEYSKCNLSKWDDRGHLFVSGPWSDPYFYHSGQFRIPRVAANSHVAHPPPVHPIIMDFLACHIKKKCVLIVFLNKYTCVMGLKYDASTKRPSTKRPSTKCPSTKGPST